MIRNLFLLFTDLHALIALNVVFGSICLFTLNKSQKLYLLEEIR